MFSKRSRYFQAQDPGTGEEYLELRFHQPIKAGRVKIYPLDDSLCDYTIEAEINGQWQVVARAEDASGAIHEHGFPPVRTNAVRLNATRSRKALAIIEFEVYEK